MRFRLITWLQRALQLRPFAFRAIFTCLSRYVKLNLHKKVIASKLTVSIIVSLHAMNCLQIIASIQWNYWFIAPECQWEKFRQGAREKHLTFRKASKLRFSFAYIIREVCKFQFYLILSTNKKISSRIFFKVEELNSFIAIILRGKRSNQSNPVGNSFLPQILPIFTFMNEIISSHRLNASIYPEKISNAFWHATSNLFYHFVVTQRK